MSERKNKWILVPLLALMIVLLTACSEKNADVDNTVSGSSDSHTETERNDIQKLRINWMSKRPATSLNK